MRPIIASLLTIMLLPLGVHAEDELYFPDRVFHNVKERNEFTVKWYSKHLETMKEPSLWKLSQKDRSAQVYRFLWLPTFHHPVSVRITESSDSIEAQVVRLDGQGGYKPGKIAVVKSKKLSKEEWAEFKRLFDRSKFWTLPTEKEFDGTAVEDGDRLVLEGVKDGKYHIVNRTSENSSPYFELCQYMILDLSGLDVQKVWKDYHHDE